MIMDRGAAWLGEARQARQGEARRDRAQPGRHELTMRAI